MAAADAMAGAIRDMIDDNGGNHAVPTVGGCTLQATYEGDQITLTDENGREASVTIADVQPSNAVIHVIDRVLLPRQEASPHLSARCAMRRSGGTQGGCFKGTDRPRSCDAPDPSGRSVPLLRAQ